MDFIKSIKSNSTDKMAIKRAKERNVSGLTDISSAQRHEDVEALAINCEWSPWTHRGFHCCWRRDEGSGSSSPRAAPASSILTDVHLLVCVYASGECFNVLLCVCAYMCLCVCG